MSHTGEMLVQNNLGTAFQTPHTGTVSSRTCYESATSLPKETTATICSHTVWLHMLNTL